MTDEKDAGADIPNFVVISDPPITSELYLWNNLITGPVLVGDTIKDKATGKTFKVVERIWPSGRDVKAKLVIRVEELK